jgi:hypothetical protein
MIKVLIHFTSNWMPIIDNNISNWEEYCQRHGYELCLKEVNSYQIYNGVEKINQIKEELSEGDIGLVMDADAIFTNFNKKIEDIIDERHDLFISYDKNGLNAGVFIVRKVEWVTRLFEHGKILIEAGRFDCEQNLLEDFLDRTNPNNNRVKILPQREINSYLYESYLEHGLQKEENGQWVEGKSYILHLPGMTLNQRLNIFKEICQKITR